MHPNQMAAYEAICLIVESNGGDCEDIERRNGAYWAIDSGGGTIRMGWDEPEYKLTAVRRGQHGA